MAAFGIGRTEAQAAMNLANYSTREFVDGLAAAVCEFGFTKGPITHEALANPLVRLGTGPEIPGSTYWTDGLKKDEYACKLLGLRIVKDFKDMPPSFRKGVTNADIPKVTMLCGAFSFGMRIMKALVPSAVYTEHADTMEKKYLLKYLDVDLEEEVRKAVEPWSLECVAEFRTILTKITNDEQLKRRARDEELASRVDQVTFEQAVEQLKNDQDAVEAWTKAQQGFNRNRQAVERTYVRNRYTKGLKKCEEFSDKRLRLVFIGSEEHAATQEFAVSKTKQIVDLPDKSGDQYHVWYYV